MALPDDYRIQIELLDLLSTAPEGKMRTRDIYSALAQRFPQLTRDETEVPYRNSVSHWANRVQFARLHLVELGYILRPHARGRGVWAISAEGRKALTDKQALADKLLAELMQS